MVTYDRKRPHSLVAKGDTNCYGKTSEISKDNWISDIRVFTEPKLLSGISKPATLKTSHDTPEIVYNSV